MAEFILYEYAWNGNQYAPTGESLTISPAPSSITKELTANWRITKKTTGYPRAKNPWRWEVSLILKGGCSPEMRKKIEFYSMRCSKYRIEPISLGDMASPEYYSGKNYPPYGHPYNENALQDLFVVFEDVSFELLEGKNWCSYTIKLRIVNKEGIPP